MPTIQQAYNNNIATSKGARQVRQIGPSRSTAVCRINEGIPLEIKSADGANYRVRERYRVAVGKTSVVVFDDKDLAHILPMLTMTGITCLRKNGRTECPEAERAHFGASERP